MGQRRRQRPRCKTNLNPTAAASTKPSSAPPSAEAGAPPAENTPTPAPPPAAALVTAGAVRSEREVQLQAELDAARTETAREREARRKAEFDAAEAERVKEDLLAQTKDAPAAAPKPPKVRRFGPLQILRAEGED